MHICVYIYMCVYVCTYAYTISDAPHIVAENL